MLQPELALTKCGDMAGRIHHHECPVSQLPASLLIPSGIDIAVGVHTIETPLEIHRNPCQTYAGLSSQSFANVALD